MNGDMRQKIADAAVNQWTPSRTQGDAVAAPAGYAAAFDKSEAEWKEATALAEAWCETKDPYRRDREIYCYRAGYLKALRQNQ